MTAAHLNEVVSIAASSGLGHRENGDFQNEISKPTALLFVAVQSLRVIGFVSARLITPVVEILDIGVCDELRGRGVGTALLQKVLQIAREEKNRESWLEVRESNQTALKFYLRHNYKIVGRRQNYYSNPIENAILMTLVISDDN